MHLTTLVTAAGLAVSSTSAFLLPIPEASDKDTLSTLPVPVRVERIPVTAESKNIKLDCPGCPRVAVADGSVQTHLELDFSIDHAADSDRLMLNGFELYPNSDPMASTLTAHLGGFDDKGKPVEWPLGFGLRTQRLAHNDEDNMELLQIDLQVIEVSNAFMDGIPNVQVKIIQMPEGGLMIADIEKTESQTVPKAGGECNTWVCRWRAIVKQQLGRLGKACHGRPGQTHAKPEGAHRHPGAHSMHGKVQGANWGHLMRNIASHILLPIAIGIVTGVSASLIGMLLGTAIVYMWRKFVRPAGVRRHRRRGHSVHKANRQESALSDEKAGLMSHQDEGDVDVPPAYVEEGLAQDKKPENDA